MPTRIFKAHNTMPFNLEHRLIDKWGFAVVSRVDGDYTVLTKKYMSDKDICLKKTIRASVNETNVIAPVFGNRFPKLSQQQQKKLEQRCDNIVNFFPDPFSQPESVRARLKIMMQKLDENEAEFVLDYMDENFPVVLAG